MNCCGRTTKLRRAALGGARAMIEMRRAQLSFGDGLIAAEIADLREPWMTHADVVLADEALMTTVYEALAKRRPNSRSRGRRGAPAEVVLRLLVLKHVRNWSYGTLEREVRANLVYRDFTRVGAGKMPDAKTMGRWGTALGPRAIAQIHERMVAIAKDKGLMEGRKMRIDTTVVETNIHYPTDSSVLGDGVRVLIRAMKKITRIAGAVGTKLRDRSRSVKRRVVEIARAARSKTAPGQAKLKRAYGQLLNSTSRVVGAARRFAGDIASRVKCAGTITEQLALDGLRAEIEHMVPLVRQVMKQTRARIFRGDTRSEGKIVSVFEPSTEIIRKGKTSKPTEFGKMVKLQEAENQIVTAYEIYDRRPADSDLLIEAIDIHQQRLGRTPHLVAADAAFHSAKNEREAKAKGVKRVCIPNYATKSAAKRCERKKRWFRSGQKWRTGCEGRISVVKRRHGLNRCRYKGDHGMKRWVGLGVIADNLINIGNALHKQDKRPKPATP
jgi:transposase, IS5 family